MKGVGPEPAARFGPRELFTPDTFLKYARALIGPINKNSFHDALPTTDGEGRQSSAKP